MGTQLLRETNPIPWSYKVGKTSTTGTWTTFGYTKRSRVWLCTADYRSRLRRAILPTQNYDDAQETHEQVSGSITMPDGVQSVTLFVSPPIFNLEHARVSACLQAAITNAAGKVGDYTVDLGVAALEARKTASMFIKAAQTISKAGQQVRRGQFLNAANTLGISLPGGVSHKRSFTKNWLEYRYGWRTLMMDVDGAVKAAAQSMVDEPPVVFVSSTVKDAWKSQAAGELGLVSPYENVRGQCKSYYDWTCMASVHYKFSVISAASAANSLGLINLASTAWELIPYSFVLDWFANTGAVLRNLGSFTGKELLDGTRCRMMACDLRRYATTGFRYPSSPSFSPVLKGAVSGRCYMRLFQRSSVGFLSVTPRIAVDLNLLKGFDAVALLSRFLH